MSIVSAADYTVPNADADGVKVAAVNPWSPTGHELDASTANPVYAISDVGVGPNGSAGYTAVNNHGVASAEAAFGGALTFLTDAQSITTTAYADSVMLRSESITVDAGAGNDWIQGTAEGVKLIDGGAGKDTYAVSDFDGDGVKVSSVNPWSVTGKELDASSAHPVFAITDAGNGPQGSAGYAAINNGGLDAAIATYGTDGGLTVLSNVESIRTTQYADTIMLRAESVNIKAGAGNDWIQGTSEGVKMIDGGDGNDTYKISDFDGNGVRVSALNPWSVTGKALDASAANPVYVVTEAGHDVPQGSAAYDALNNHGLAYAVEAFGDITVLSDVETLVGTQYNDSFLLRNEADIIHAGAGNDWIQLGGGDDIAFGDDGKDTLLGGAGADRLTGGAGADTFVFNAVADGHDVVVDFHASEGDKVRLTNISQADAQAAFDAASSTSAGLVVAFDGSDSITFAGVTSASDITWLVA